jgi:hypothetical protein
VPLRELVVNLLVNGGTCLDALDRSAEAIVLYDSAVPIIEALSAAGEPGWHRRLALILTKQAASLAVDDQWERAATTSGRAIEVHREVAPPGGDHELALALRTFAQIRLGHGEELEPAVEAINECLACHSQVLNASRELSYLDQVYQSELVLAALLRRQGNDVAAGRIESEVRRQHMHEVFLNLMARREQESGEAPSNPI